MAAFNNMNANEKRKKSRDEIENYIELLEIIASRYFSIRYLCEMCNEVTETDARFTRSLSIPSLIVPNLHNNVKYSKYHFLSRTLLKNKNSTDELTFSLDLKSYIDLESKYQSLLVTIEGRNKSHSNIMLKMSNDKDYAGKEIFMSYLTDYEKAMSFYEFSSFLKESEFIVLEMNQLIMSYQKITKGLSEAVSVMFDPTVINEFGGIVEVPLYEDQLLFEYVELTDIEISKIEGSNFPLNAA